jgi:ABC-type multidrug transport system fused ATPase/permease subunit
VSQIQNPVMSLGEMLRRLISVLASVPRIMALEEMPRDEQAEHTAVAAGPVEILGEHIAFAYDKEAIFEDFSFRIGEGEVVAVTGHSGAGKTTLIKLLLGFAAPDAGALQLRAGEQVLPITAATRNYFSYVPQGNTLFHGTIRENLQMGDRKADDAALWEALEIACAREFVEKLPQGLDTMLGEQSSGISEGQAQRIAIARAMLRQAPVVIFDEATSALDEETELHILEQIRKKGKNTTYLIITHRQKALEYCTSRIIIG